MNAIPMLTACVRHQVPDFQPAVCWGCGETYPVHHYVYVGPSCVTCLIRREAAVRATDRPVPSLH
jgi:hypothetical protein